MYFNNLDVLFSNFNILNWLILIFHISYLYFHYLYNLIDHTEVLHGLHWTLHIEHIDGKYWLIIWIDLTEHIVLIEHIGGRY